MAEATIRCPKCGHEGIVITELLNSDLALISDSQQAEIEQLRSELSEKTGELDECRNLLRELLAAMRDGDGWLPQWGEGDEWVTRAAKAAGGDDARVSGLRA